MLEKFRELLNSIGEKIGLVNFYNIENENHEIHIQATPTTCFYIEILKTPDSRRVLQMNYSKTEKSEIASAIKSFRLNNRPGNHTESIPISPEKFFKVILEKISIHE